MHSDMELAASTFKQSVRSRHFVAWLGTILTLGSGAGLAFATVGVRVYSRAPWLLQKWVYSIGSIDARGAIGSAAAIIAWSLILYLGFALFYRGIPGRGWTKGLAFGFAFWAVTVLSLELFDLNTTRIPSVISVFGWMLMFLPVLLATGAVLGRLYPARGPVDRAINTLDYEPGLRVSLRTASEDIKESRGLIAVAVVVNAIFQMIWAFFGYFLLARAQVSRVDWVFRPGLLEGRIAVGQLLGIIGAAIYWSAITTVVYFLFRRGLDCGSVTSGLMFGCWAAAAVALPLGIFLLPGSRMPTESVLTAFVLVPFFMVAGMGFIAGVILSG